MAYDAHKAGLNVTSADLRGKLHQAMYQPRVWGTAAKLIQTKEDFITQHSNANSDKQRRAAHNHGQAMEDLEAELAAQLHTDGPKSGSYGARNGFFGRIPVKKDGDDDDSNSSNDDPPPDYSFQAITCADAPDANYTTKDVFDELVRVTREVSQVFGPQWGDVSTSRSIFPEGEWELISMECRRRCTATIGLRVRWSGSSDLGIIP